MNRIKSFTINHNLLMPGFYISREDGDVITYDLRTRSDGLSLKQQSGGMAQSHIPRFHLFGNNIYSQFRDGK